MKLYLNFLLDKIKKIIIKYIINSSVSSTKIKKEDNILRLRKETIKIDLLELIRGLMNLINFFHKQNQPFFSGLVFGCVFVFEMRTPYILLVNSSSFAYKFF